MSHSEHKDTFDSLVDAIQLNSAWEAQLANDEHTALVRSLMKPGADMQAELTPRDLELIHMAMGVAGEAGELLDAIKKHTIYRKPIDLHHVVEELGDLEFFMAGIRQLLGIDRDLVLRSNVQKLTKRYASLSYSNEDAVARADKQPGDV